MRYLLILALLWIQLFGTMILNLNVKERPDRVELILNFDVPYSGALIKKREKDRLDIILKKVKILAPWQKKLTSPIVYQIEAKPLKNATLISFYTTTNPKLYAARSKDGFSLKLTLKSPTPSKESKESGLAGKIDLGKILFWMLAIIGGGIVSLLLYKLFQSQLQGVRKTKRIVVDSSATMPFKILFEKPLDEHNKIALISFKGVDYLVLIGSNNVLLGKYKEGEITTHEEFERALETQDLSGGMHYKHENEVLTTIEEYKRRASGNF